jgi:hypothetical protein
VFKDERRNKVWNEIRQHALRGFAKQLTPEVFTEAASQACLPLGLDIFLPTSSCRTHPESSRPLAGRWWQKYAAKFSGFRRLGAWLIGNTT